VDQLYIHPDFQRRGIGKALLDFARSLSPGRLWLYTLQINTNGTRTAALFTKRTALWQCGLASAPRPSPSRMWNIIGGLGEKMKDER